MANQSKKSKKSNKNSLKTRYNLFSKTSLIFVVVFGLVGGAVIWRSLAATSPTIALNQANPQYGQVITLTAVYPNEARKKIGRRQEFQSQINVYCTQNGTTVYYEIGDPAKETNLGGGWWQGVSGPFTLGGRTSVGGNIYDWSSGSASCAGFSGYYTTDSTSALTWHSLASVNFQVN